MAPMANLESLGDEQTLIADGPLGEQTEDRPARGPRAQLAKGSVLGRYLLLERVGVGGMGEVYAAYDPELDRKVAIKLLHAQPNGGSTSSSGAARLLREAQAMARLTSPHVITVHDVGTFDEQVFMAMEFVEGRTLGQWLEDEKPSWREALKVLLKAGRGLAAAHRAGLIHRDFKPDNVLLGDDRRVLVADFGLARANGGALPDPPPSATPAELGSSLDTRMTVTGAVMGTPAYMSPEAHAGAVVDASSDQFGFCVALYEALYGERPYAGETLAALTFQVLHGQLREPPPTAKVPGWLRRVVLRGLSRDPKQRYPDMDALIRALARDVSGQRRRLGLLAVASVVLIGGVGLGVALVNAPDEDPLRSCVAAEALLVKVWDDARKQEIRAAIEASGVEYGPQTWRALELTLDAYTSEWLAAHRDACEATYLRQEQSVRMLDLQVACLGDRLQHLRSLTELIELSEQPDRELLANLDQMAVSLPPVARCGDSQALLARVAPPEDPQISAKVEELRGELARVSAMRAAGRGEATLAPVEELVERASALAYAPIAAEALYQRGRTRDDLDQPEGAEDDYSLAISAAIASGHDELIAKAGIALVGMFVIRQHRLREADHWQRIAAAGIERFGGDAMLESELLIASHRGLTERGQFEAARAAANAALALREQLHGPKHVDLVPALTALGRGYFVEGELVEMERTLRRATEILEHHYGPEHPALTTALSNLAAAHLLQGDAQLAIDSFERVLRLRTQRLGPDHILTVDARSNLGITLIKLGKHDQAEHHLRFVQAAYEQRYGPQNPGVGEAYVNLANAVEARDVNLSIEYLEHALAIFEADDTDQGRRLLTITRQLGAHARARDNLERAEQMANRGLAIVRQIDGDTHAETRALILDLVSIKLARRDLAGARALLEPTLSGLDADEDPLGTGRAQFLMGQLMVVSGERERGLASAREGLEALPEQGEGVAELREEIVAWLAAG